MSAKSNVELIYLRHSQLIGTPVVNAVEHIPFQESSNNVVHDWKTIFIHNPKAAGTSVKKLLGVISSGDHRTPSELVHPRTWESYFSFIIIRNPFTRLVSSFRYHTSSEYRGFYFKHFPHLHSLSFEDYFATMTQRTSVLRPQVDYLFHKDSNKPIDLIIRYENLANDIEEVREKLNIQNSLEHLNASAATDGAKYFNNENFLRSVSQFYAEDLEKFNYGYETDT